VRIKILKDYAPRFRTTGAHHKITEGAAPGCGQTSFKTLRKGRGVEEEEIKLSMTLVPV
jgi:hypothetical protein